MRPSSLLWCGRCLVYHDNWREVAPGTWVCRNYTQPRHVCGYTISWNPEWDMYGIEVQDE
jgi:hypothetical protein